MKRSACFNLIRGERLVLVRLWQRGELSDKQLPRSLERISWRERRLQDGAIAQELDGQTKEKG